MEKIQPLSWVCVHCLWVAVLSADIAHRGFEENLALTHLLVLLERHSSPVSQWSSVPFLSMRCSQVHDVLGRCPPLKTGSKQPRSWCAKNSPQNTKTHLIYPSRTENRLRVRWTWYVMLSCHDRVVTFVRTMILVTMLSAPHQMLWPPSSTNTSAYRPSKRTIHSHGGRTTVKPTPRCIGWL